MAGILLSWAQRMFSIDWNIGWFWKNIVGRLLGSVIPGSWLASGARSFSHENDIDAMTGLSDALAQSWQLLTSANIWIGVAAGAAMIYAAIYLRGWRDEG